MPDYAEAGARKVPLVFIKAPIGRLRSLRFITEYSLPKSRFRHRNPIYSHHPRIKNTLFPFPFSLFHTTEALLAHLWTCIQPLITSIR